MESRTSICAPKLTRRAQHPEWPALRNCDSYRLEPNPGAAGRDDAVVIPNSQLPAQGSGPRSADGDGLVLPVRIELTTSPLPRGCSTTELRQHRRGMASRAGANARRNAAILATRAPVAQPFAMTDRPKEQQKQRRAGRLSAALRDNLKRRKAQARGRREQGVVEAPGSSRPHDSAGIVEDKASRE